MADNIGINVLKPIVHIQVSLLRMWANNVERFARNYEKGLEDSAAAAKEQADKARAA